MHPEEKNIYLLIITTSVILGIILIYFFYSILKYHKRDLKDKLEIIYGKNGILEEEKKRIGREIHDGVSSSLAGIKLLIESLQVTSEKDKQRVLDISNKMDNSLSNLRYILSGLMEISIKNKTLSNVLIDYFEKFNANNIDNNLQIEYSFKMDLNFDFEKSNHIYRIFQEAISNTQRHSNATKLEIGLKDLQNYIEISFKDNGDGFDLEKVSTSSSGIGLKNIIYRTEIMNGSYSIHSETNQGTEIILKIPI